jgi:hypothetical protein
MLELLEREASPLSQATHSRVAELVIEMLSPTQAHFLHEGTAAWVEQLRAALAPLSVLLSRSSKDERAPLDARLEKLTLWLQFVHSVAQPLGLVRGAVSPQLWEVLSSSDLRSDACFCGMLRALTALLRQVLKDGRGEMPPRASEAVAPLNRFVSGFVLELCLGAQPTHDEALLVRLAHLLAGRAAAPAGGDGNGKGSGDGGREDDLEQSLTSSLALHVGLLRSLLRCKYGEQAAADALKKQLCEEARRLGTIDGPLASIYVGVRAVESIDSPFFTARVVEDDPAEEAETLLHDLAAGGDEVTRAAASDSGNASDEKVMRALDAAIRCRRALSAYSGELSGVRAADAPPLPAHVLELAQQLLTLPSTPAKGPTALVRCLRVFVLKTVERLQGLGYVRRLLGESHASLSSTLS